MESNGSEYVENHTHLYSNSSEHYEDEKEYYEQFLIYYDHRTKMCIFVFGPLIFLGLVGNVISFFTWGRMTQQHAITFLLRSLAVMDSCVLLGLVLRAFTDPSATKYYADGWLYNAAYAQGPYMRVFVDPLKYMALLANIWTSLCIGMNRYIVVCQPLQAARLCTVSRARKQVICIVVLSVLSLIPSFFECQVRKSTDGSLPLVCPLLDNKWYYYIWYIGSGLVAGSLIPFSLLLGFCVRIIATLRASRKNADRHGNRRQDSSVTSMVLVLLGIFLVCHTFSWVHILLGVLLPKTVYWYNVLSYAYFCKEILLIFNSSVNWLLYFVHIREFRWKLCKICYQQSGANPVSKPSQSEPSQSEATGSTSC